MTFRALILLFLVLGSGGGFAVGAPTALPLQHGERLTYRVSWAIVPGAGEIEISARQDVAANQLIVTTNTATRGLAKWLLKFEATANSIFDLQTGKLVSLHEENETKGKRSAHSVTFDYASRQATYTTIGGAVPPRKIPMPPGNPTDLMMGLLQTRSWDLKPGQKRDALVLFDDDFYELTIHMARYEEVETPAGRFRTVVLEPRMDKTPPKGMFKRGSSVRIWIAQENHRLPVKFEVEFKIGTGTAILESYDPPSPPMSRAAATSTALNGKDPRS